MSHNHRVEGLVDNRLAELWSKDAAELRLLPPLFIEIVSLDGKEIRLTIYHDTAKDDSHRIVLQGVRERWGGMMAKVVAKGFVTTAEGIKRNLEPEELYDFT